MGGPQTRLEQSHTMTELVTHTQAADEGFWQQDTVHTILDHNGCSMGAESVVEDQEEGAGGSQTTNKRACHGDVARQEFVDKCAITTIACTSSWNEE